MSMKKSIFALIFAAFTSMFALTSCEKEQEPADLLVGHWMLSSINMTTNGMSMDIDPAQLGIWCEFSFSSDGNFTCDMYEDENGTTGETLVGTYDLLASDQKSVLNLYMEGEVTALTLLQLDSNSLILTGVTSEDGVDVETTLSFRRGRMHMLE